MYVFQSISVPQLPGMRVRMDGSHEITLEDRSGGRDGVSSEPKETSQDRQTAREMAMLPERVRAAPPQTLPDTGLAGRS